MSAAIAQHLNVVGSAIVRIEEWANVLFVVVKGIGARFVSKKVAKTVEWIKKMEISVCDMRGAGKAGYVAKIGDRHEKTFLNGKAYKHGASAKTITVEISEDGIYEICDANFGGRKRRIDFILVKGGQEVFRSESLEEVERQEMALAGQIPEWAVCTEESMVSDRAIAPSYPGLKQDAPEYNGKVYLAAGGFFAVEIKYNSIRVNMLKNTIPASGRKWNGDQKRWEISKDYGLSLLDLCQEWGDIEIRESFLKALGMN